MLLRIGDTFVLLQDGALDDDELNRFQVRCFNAPLQPPELQGVKDVVGDRIPGVSPASVLCNNLSFSQMMQDLMLEPMLHAQGADMGGKSILADFATQLGFAGLACDQDICVQLNRCN